MLELWKRLLKGHRQNSLSPADRELFKRWAKAIALLRDDPRHPGLRTHEIEPLSRRYGRKVFQSYLYGPEDGHITVVGLEPHPEDRKSRGYDRVSLSNLPPRDPPG
ncbi:MAG TPA: hypothetical protein VGB24_19250 [Longimicrobium sp.]